MAGVVGDADPLQRGLERRDRGEVELVGVLDGVVAGDRRVREVGVHLAGLEREEGVAVLLEFLDVDRRLARLGAGLGQAVALIVTGSLR